MNLQELRIELERDEGVKYEIYLDHLGLPTFGIGHLIRTDDPEYGQPVGTPVTEERVEAAFQADMISVGITTTKPERELLKSGANLVVESLDEINLSILKDLIKNSK